MKMLPIDIENFKDKTIMMKDVYSEKVAFYTRPRRFGKTLNISRRCPPRRAVLFLYKQGKRKQLLD